jgi:hypothetical protein
VKSRGSARRRWRRLAKTRNPKRAAPVDSEHGLPKTVCGWRWLGYRSCGVPSEAKPARNVLHQQQIRGIAMSELVALSVSVAILGGIWAFIALGPLASFALVWAGFIAAGCFFAAGGDTKALTKTIAGLVWGAIVAWIALLIIAHVPVPALGTVWPAIVVGVTVFFLVIVASVDMLSVVPANVYGYAALVGYTLSAGKLDALTAVDNSNPLFLIVVSAVLGAVLGYLMAQLAVVLKAKPAK